LPQRVCRGVSVQFVFATYLAQVAEVEVSKDGAVRVRRVVCAVDCGTVVNPDTVRAQIESAVMFGITAESAVKRCEALVAYCFSSPTTCSCTKKGRYYKLLYAP